jgi:hypothetical protein
LPVEVVVFDNGSLGFVELDEERAVPTERRADRPRQDERHQEALLVRSARGSSIGRHLAVGAVAGAVGTAAMDFLLYRRYRREGGKDSFWRWESAAGVTRWEEASAPGQLGRKLERLVTRRPPPDNWARTTTNVVHWATGIGWAVQYGALAGVTPKHPLARALALGPVVWLSGYAILPLAGVYEPIWKYDARTLGEDLSAHLVYGAATSAAFAALGGRHRLLSDRGGPG